MARTSRPSDRHRKNRSAKTWRFDRKCLQRRKSGWAQQTSVIEISAVQTRTDERNTVKFCARQIDTRQIGTTEIGPKQVRTVELRFLEIEIGKIQPFQIPSY